MIAEQKSTVGLNRGERGQFKPAGLSENPPAVPPTLKEAI
jgi:hypothetical protein